MGHPIILYNNKSCHSQIWSTEFNFSARTQAWMSIIASITTCVLRFLNAFTSIFLCYYCIYALFLFLLLFVWENMSYIYIYIHCSIHSFETRPSPAGRPGTRNWSQAELKKNRKRKNPAWPGDPVDFCFFFFTKTTLFWFKKKELIRATRWPGQNLKPGLGPSRVWKLWLHWAIINTKIPIMSND